MNKQCPKCGHQYDPQAVTELGGACPRCVADLLRSQPGDASGSLRPSASETSEASAKEVAPVREDDVPPLEPGARLRGFEITEYIGRGGMGFVYKANQAGLDRLVALKVLAPRLAATPEFAARFGREAKALAALSHPNIVQVFDYGEEGGLYFLAMEFVDGASLRSVLASQKLPPEIALRYVPQICNALEYAHGRGVIHRDIKPENILIDKVGNLKIADFGLAKMVAGTAVSPDAATAPASHATVSGQVMGTPHYMAPEQVENTAAVDHRADIYSLGVVFYEMLTGELPLGRFPSPSQKVQVDVRFDEVVLRALEKEPGRRYQSVTDMKGDVATLGAAGGKSGSTVAVHSRDGKKVVEIGPDGIRVENGDKRVVIGGGLGSLIGSAASAAAGIQGIAARPRMSWLALFSALCLPVAFVIGAVASAVAYVLGGREELSFGVGLLCGSPVLLLGLILGIAALGKIRNSGGRLTGRALAWIGVLPLPVALLLVLALAAIRLRGGDRASSMQQDIQAPVESPAPGGSPVGGAPRSSQDQPVAGGPTSAPGPGDPRTIGQTYGGTADIETFKALLYRCFADYNPDFLRSMNVPAPPSQAGPGEAAPLQLKPGALARAPTDMRSWEVSDKDKRYSFPDLPAGAKVRYWVKITWRDRDSKDNSSLSLGLPVVEHRGRLYISGYKAQKSFTLQGTVRLAKYRGYGAVINGVPDYQDYTLVTVIADGVTYTVHKGYDETTEATLARLRAMDGQAVEVDCAPASVWLHNEFPEDAAMIVVNRIK